MVMDPWKLKLRRAFGVAIAATLFTPALALADYPDRPLRFIVAAGAGSIADVLARAYAEKLKIHLGQAVVVENKPGANTSIGTDAIA